MPARHALRNRQPSTTSPNIQSPHTSPRLKHATPSPSLSDLSSPGSTPSRPDLSDLNDNDENLSLRATRKRKLDEISTVDKDTRRISPPWKNPAANGPSSVIVDGRRKSSRATAPSVQPPSDAKRARGAHANGARIKTKPVLNGTSHRTTNGHTDGDASRRSSRLSTGSLPKSHKVPTPRISLSPKKIRYSSPPRARSVRPPRLLVNAKPTPAPPTPPRFNPRPRRSAGHYGQDDDIVGSSPLTRIRLHVGEPTLVRQHPSHFPKARTHPSFEEWLANDNPLEEEDSSLLTDAGIQREVQIRLQIVKAMEDGGPLSEGRRTRVDMLTPTNISPRYGPWDFVVGHALNFSKLVGAESRRHRSMATRLARSAGQAILTGAKWNFLHTQSEEAIHEKEVAINKKRFKQLMKDLEQKWMMARREVEAVKLAQWEKEQELIGNKALDEMLDQSTTLLHRQFHDSSELQSEDTSRAQSILMDEEMYEEMFEEVDLDENVDEETDGSDSGTSVSEEIEESEDDHNLTESDGDDVSEKGADEDMNLTLEELRVKYSKALEDLSESEDFDESEDENEEITDDELEHEAVLNGILDEETPVPTSDATPEHDQVTLDDVDDNLLDDSNASSTDMSEDMGDSDASDESGSDDDGAPERGGLSDLLGLYLSKDEILELQQAETRSGTEEVAEVGPEDIKDAIMISTQEDPISVDGISDKKPPYLNLVELPSDGTEDDNAMSTSRDENDAVSTPTTSIIPSTPRPYRTEVSPLLRGTLREYQHDGVDWLAKLYSGGRNGILADEMGLGKTIQTIALLAHLATHHEVWGPHLVVVPTSVILNWEMEFKKWCPAFRILTYYGNIEERKAKRRGWTNDDKWNVCITSYQLILQDAQAFKKRAWHYLVLDEAHNIKNFQTQRWQTLLTFRTHSRLLLTGTPLQNNLQELWSLLYFLMPAGTDGAGGFADLEKFLNSMKRPADQILDQGRQQLDPEAQARVNKLHEILRPFLLRRLKSEVEKQMPAKYEHVVYCRLSKRQRQLYDEFMGRADTRRTLASGNYMSIINCLMSLRKVCNHPDLFETRQIVTSLAMPRSAVASYEIKELLVRRRLLSGESVDLDFCGLVPAANEGERNLIVRRLKVLEASRQLEKLASRESEKLQATAESRLGDADSVFSHMIEEARKNAVGDLRNRAEHMTRVSQRHQIYGKELRDSLRLPNRFDPPLPSKKRPLYSYGDWFLDRSTTVAQMMPMVKSVSDDMGALITKFGCVTPAVVAEDVVPLTLTKAGVQVVGRAMSLMPNKDPYHEARIRLSIAFPDKRLLQYDCGKLQRLERLLRDLQAGGHRCLIFTQMTKVLDILEQFLNIHGHRYLRLDGATKIEQRQILTDRFNNDDRILAFILSSRSGGLGINLTGADTVIFYDLDWNPAMDKQCQDRCHRIGQTRDVHIYRFVSEYTIEANILRKSNQKRLLDDVIIQRGEFTTDIFNRVTYRDALDAVLDGAEAPDAAEEDGAAAVAVDRVLGDLAGLPQALEAVEDKEDAAAAKAAQKEMVVADDLDFRATDPPAGGPGEAQTVVGARADGGGASNPAAAMDAALAAEEESGEVPHVDDYLVRFLMREMEGVVVRAPVKARPKPKKKKADWKRGK